MANVTVHPVFTIRFEVTADVPDRIEIGKQPAITAQQLTPLTPIQILMYDSNNNQMTGDILTANDPWRVCVSLIPGQTAVSQNLMGKLDVPFRDGAVTFDDLVLTTKSADVQLEFQLCYAGGNEVADLEFEPVYSDSISVVNVNECINALHDCDTNADCTDTDGHYKCDCLDGYIGNGFVCMNQVRVY